MPTIQKLSETAAVTLAIYNDLRFPRTQQNADYDSRWKSTMTASDLYRIIATWESSVLFAAREGWIPSVAPECSRDKCKGKKCTSYIYQRASSTWVWRFPCCKIRTTILKDTMFYKSHYGPSKIIEIMWMFSMRTPLTTMSYCIFGRETSEIYA